MRFTKSALAVAMLMLTADGALADSLASASADVRVEVTFIRASCDITVPSSYNLGVLTPGTGPKEHRDLKITWTCKSDTPIKTALTADVVTGSKDVSDEKVYLVTNGNQTTGAALSLREGNSFIKLTGNQGDYFCRDTDAVDSLRLHTCTLTPVTDVSRNGVLGHASATLRFEVGYP